jgi:hypothetical protein
VSRARRSCLPALAALAALVLAPARAVASPSSVFGSGARSASLALADVADPEPTAATQANAAAAAEPGVRVRAGYGYGALALHLNGADANVRDASGIDLAAQLGARLARSLDGGIALALRVPDGAFARISFRPATEPQLVLYEASLQRASFDLVGALRYGAFSVGAGAAITLDVAGDGTRFALGQDARGAGADASADVTLPYRAAPIVAARADLGRVRVGATFRGALGVDLHLESQNRVDVSGNPLNGTTTVTVQGTSGYDPATVDLGVAVAVTRGLTALGAIEYAAWHAAPAPVADVDLDLKLGTTPGLRTARFVEPRFRDTLSPRLGLELRWPAAGGALAGAPTPSGAATDWRYALRAGWLYAPSPVPRQTGLTSYADASRHAIALDGGVRFGRVAGVDLSASLGAQHHLFVPRDDEKPSPALPNASITVDGHIVYVAGALEGAWR